MEPKNSSSNCEGVQRRTSNHAPYTLQYIETDVCYLQLEDIPVLFKMLHTTEYDSSASLRKVLININNFIEARKSQQETALNGPTRLTSRRTSAA